MHYKGSTYMTTDERVRLAGDDKKDRLYERKHNQKAIKVLTVAAYVLCVSLAAIMLSSYYLFIWNPTAKPNIIQTKSSNCDKILIPESLARHLANASRLSYETFIKNYSMHFKLGHEEHNMIPVEEIKPNLMKSIERAVKSKSSENSQQQKSILKTISLDLNTKSKDIPKFTFDNNENDEDDEEENDDDDENDDENDDDIEADYEPSGHGESILEKFNNKQQNLLNSNFNQTELTFDQNDTN